jgi:hypothetical protein
METNNSNTTKFDPVGIEVLVAIFSTSITLVATLHQFGVFSKKHKKLSIEFENLHNEILRLQNSLDDFILTLHRNSHNLQDHELENSSMTISQTLLYLEHRDYIRWLDIEDKIKNIDANVYKIISKIRDLSFRYFKQELVEPFNQNLTDSFDTLILNMGQLSFGEFISELRKNLTMIDKTIYSLLNE